MPTTSPPPPGDPPRPTTFQTRSSPSNIVPACLHRESQLNTDPTPTAATASEHPYLRLYQYLHHKPNPSAEQGTAPPQVAPPPAQGSSQEKSFMARPLTHAAAPGPPVQHLDVRQNPSPLGASDSSPNPPPPVSRRGNAPSPPSLSPYHKQKTFLSTPNSTPPLPSKPPPSPGNRRRPPTSGGNTPPPPAAPCGAPVSLSATGRDSDVQHQTSVSNRRKASSPGGHTPTRGMAPPPPSSSPVSCHQEARATPPCRETTAPPAHVREAPPPPPVRTSPCLSSDHPVRVKPPAPPPPPSLQSGNASPTCSASCLNADFESRFSFHRVEDFPPPEIFKLLSNVYPSKTQKVMRGAPPLPPVGR